MKKMASITQASGNNSGQESPTRLFIAAKLDFSVDGLLRLLADDPDNTVVACVEPSEACWDKLRDTHPEILLLHRQALAQPLNEFFTRIKTTVPGIQIIVFCQHMEDALLLNIIRAGAAGYINENMSSGHLLLAIRCVRDGHLWVERRILETLALEAIDVERTLENTILERIDTVRHILTRQETAVFKLMLDGLATKEIAARMQLSEQSVKLYLGLIFKKFQVSNRSQLILQVFSRICPVSNVYRLIRMALDKRRIEMGLPPLIEDPLDKS